MKKIAKRKLKTRLLEFFILHDGYYTPLEIIERLLEILNTYIDFEDEEDVRKNKDS